MIEKGDSEMMARDLKYDAFYTYDEMAAFLMEAEQNSPDFVKVKILTTTEEGRNVFLVIVTDFTAGAEEDKPAYYIQAGLHAQEGAGTTAALHVIHSLLANPAYRDLLAKTSFYIIPRINPDGTEYALTTGGDIRSRFKETTRKNGLLPKDLDGDGRILSMRWRDPAGPLKEDEVDPRIMTKREPGDKGPFYYMTTEGMIRDYDGGDIVAGLRDIDFNRNYPVNWRPVENSSSYPFSEPEVRAVGDFTASHPNIFAGVDFHCGTNAILRPTSKPDSEMDQDDLNLILSIGRLAEKTTGFPLMHDRDYRQPWRSPAVHHGNSNDWAYFKLGISHYVVELGNGFNCAGITPKEYFEADERTSFHVFIRRIFEFHDSHKSKIFAPWKEFDHPQLGKVEIGGMINGSGYYMYPPVMEKISPKTTAFVISHAQMRPGLVITNAEALGVGGGIYRIRATAANTGEFSVNVMKGGGAPDMRHPIRLKLIASEETQLLSRTSLFEFSIPGNRGEKGNAEWFIRSSKGSKVTIEANHPRAGVTKKEMLL